MLNFIDLVNEDCNSSTNNYIVNKNNADDGEKVRLYLKFPKMIAAVWAIISWQVFC